MGKINLVRVFTGGLVAALLLAVVADTSWALVIYGRLPWIALFSDPEGTLPLFIRYEAINIALGIAFVWLYAAIRPRFGAGIKTAMIAGIALWIIGFGLPILWMTGLEADSLAVTAWPLGYVVSLAGTLIATLGGAWVYREGDIT